MSKFNKILTAAACVCLLSSVAYAQRLIPGQWELTFGIGAVPRSLTPLNGEVSFNKVNRGSKMVCRIDFMTHKSYYETVQLPEPGNFLAVRNYDVRLNWGYLWDFAHNRKRSVNFWGGVTADLGARFRTYLPENEPDYDGYVPMSMFTYGFSPELNLEVFPYKDLSFSFYCRPKMQFYARESSYKNDPNEQWFFPVFGLQLNYYMFVGK